MTDATEADARRTGGPVPTAGDLSVLHLHDRHSDLGLGPDDLVGMYRTILLARVLDQKIWSLNRMGKAAFVVSGQGHEGAQVGSAWALRAGHDVVLPYYRDTGVLLTLGMSVEQILLAVLARAEDPNRSEEHTSELQSLMRISYAVFCLKKNKKR